MGFEPMWDFSGGFADRPVRPLRHETYNFLVYIKPNISSTLFAVDECCLYNCFIVF